MSVLVVARPGGFRVECLDCSWQSKVFDTKPKANGSARAHRTAGAHRAATRRGLGAVDNFGSPTDGDGYAEHPLGGAW